MKELANLILSRCVRSGDCLVWPNATSWGGYGTITYDKVQYACHRVVCEAFQPKCDNKPFVLHSCDNPKCCNPEHLSWGDNAKNMQQRRDRKPTGTQKLLRYDAWKIKFIESGLHKDIALTYNVSESTVTRIKSGLRWSDLKEDEYNV